MKIYTDVLLDYTKTKKFQSMGIFVKLKIISDYDIITDLIYLYEFQGKNTFAIKVTG